MSEPTEKVIQIWMESVSQFGDSQQLRQQVVRAGKFLSEMGQLPSDDIHRYLGQIDFSMSLTVVRLPNSVFVRYPQEDQKFWFTDTGFGPQAFASASRIRERRLYTPRSTVPALKLTAFEIEDCYALQDIISNLPPATKARFGQPTRGAGTQYLVVNQNLMKEI